ncbi:unnamed protein product [Orchesella dallaii]|uniref:AAA+ ATPase domain-containing protein n=1 Tax=Orchesella dallaii TaxID=48710 RepID=A0ABP1RBM3_9HEXA
MQLFGLFEKYGNLYKNRQEGRICIITLYVEMPIFLNGHVSERKCHSYNISAHSNIFYLGVGKSSIVRAVVNECSMHLQKMSLSPVTFFNFSMNHILGAYHGHTEKNLSYLFDKANEKQPSVILIDEIDSLTMKRTENERESTRKIKNHLLSLMDGLAGHARITVVGTTNKAEDMDVGFLRRFDRRCYIGLPNAKEREFVLRKCIGELQVDDETINFAEFADNTYNFSPSDIKSFVKLAYHNAHWRDMACAMLEQLETRGVIIPDNLQTTASFKRITNEALADARRCITATNNTKDVMDLESFAKLYATDYDDPTVFINDPCNFPHCPTNWLTAIQCCICSIAEILD